MYIGLGSDTDNRVTRYRRDLASLSSLSETTNCDQLPPPLPERALPLESVFPWNINHDVQPRIDYNRGDTGFRHARLPEPVN